MSKTGEEKAPVLENFYIMVATYGLLLTQIPLNYNNKFSVLHTISSISRSLRFGFLVGSP